MKKIVVLLAVILADIILLNSVAATDRLSFIPASYFPILLLFLTLITTIFLFYEEHIEKVHQQWDRLYTRRVEGMFAKNAPERATAVQEARTPPVKGPSLAKSFLIRKKETPGTGLQYQFIDLITSQIDEMRKEGRSEQEIVDTLKEERWDPQVIYLAISRAKKDEKTSS